MRRLHSQRQGTASLLEQISRLVDHVSRDNGMHPAQWSALRYFANADVGARTTNGLARFQGTNPGTASRTIGSLVRRGLLTVVVDSDDRRVRIVSLTDAGHAALDGDPLSDIMNALSDWRGDDLRVLNEHLQRVYLDLKRIDK